MATVREEKPPAAPVNQGDAQTGRATGGSLAVPMAGDVSLPPQGG